MKRFQLNHTKNNILSSDEDPIMDPKLLVATKYWPNIVNINIYIFLNI